MPAGDSAEAGRFTRTSTYRRAYTQNRLNSVARRAARAPQPIHFGGKGTRVEKKGRKDPVARFLGGMAGFLGDAVSGAEDTFDIVTGRKTPTRRKVGNVSNEIRRAGKKVVGGYVRGQIANIKPEAFRSPAERRMVAAQGQSLDVSPGILRAIMRAGGATIPNSGKLPLDELAGRLPQRLGAVGSTRKRPGAFRVDPRRQTGDINVSGRLPWLVDRTSGEVHVGPVGANHGQLYPRGRSFSDFRQGWMYNPVDEYTNITIGTGNPLTALSPMEEKGVYQLLYNLLGRGSPITDDMVRVQRSGPGFAEGYGQGAHNPFYSFHRDIAARQGSRANELFERAGGPMTEDEFADFVQQELMRKKRRRR